MQIGGNDDLLRTRAVQPSPTFTASWFTVLASWVKSCAAALQVVADGLLGMGITAADAEHAQAHQQCAESESFHVWPQSFKGPKKAAACFRPRHDQLPPLPCAVMRRCEFARMTTRRGVYPPTKTWPRSIGMGAVGASGCCVRRFRPTLIKRRDRAGRSSRAAYCRSVRRSRIPRPSRMPRPRRCSQRKLLSCGSGILPPPSATPSRAKGNFIKSRRAVGLLGVNLHRAQAHLVGGLLAPDAPASADYWDSDGFSAELS